MKYDLIGNMRGFSWFGTICTIQKHNEKTHGGVLLLVKLQAEACHFTKTDTLTWMFFTFFKLYKFYQIAQSIIYHESLRVLWDVQIWAQTKENECQRNLLVAK